MSIFEKEWEKYQSDNLSNGFSDDTVYNLYEVMDQGYKQDYETGRESTEDIDQWYSGWYGVYIDIEPTDFTRSEYFEEALTESNGFPQIETNAKRVELEHIVLMELNFTFQIDDVEGKNLKDFDVFENYVETEPLYYNVNATEIEYPDIDEPLKVIEILKEVKPKEIEEIFEGSYWDWDDFVAVYPIADFDNKDGLLKQAKEYAESE